MSTTPKNTIVDSSFATRQYPNLAGNSINQGDMVYVSQSTYDLFALDSDAHAQYFAGISNDTWPVGAYPTTAQVGPNVGGGPTYPILGMNVTRVGRVNLLAANGITFTPGQLVYYSTNAQTVTNTGGSHAIGVVADLANGSQNGLVGTGSNTIQIDIPAAWPIY